MKPADISLMTSGLLATLSLVCCVALPDDPKQVAGYGAQNDSWLLFTDDAPQTEEQQVRNKREAPAEKENAKKKSNKKRSFEKECLKAHNKWRKLHQAEPLVWDKKIAEFAKKRADSIAASDGAEFKHLDHNDYGENLAGNSRATTSCSELIKMWYDEVNEYDYNDPKFSVETGHFTQLVWRSTKRVGCARAVSEGPKGGVTLVCNYDPPGNFVGEFANNVKDKVKSVSKNSRTATTTTRPPTTSGRSATDAEATGPPDTASSSAAATSEKPKKKGSFEKECLEAHNKWRKLHQAEPLVWDKKIAEFAKKRADSIAASDGSEFKHLDHNDYGENLAGNPRATTSCSELIKMLYDEVDEYDYNNPNYSVETGHFTQLVWRSTKRVGCARAVSEGPEGGVTLVCNYDPPGNFPDEFAKNVKDKVKSVSKNSRTATTTTRPPTTSGRSATGAEVTGPPDTVSSSTSEQPKKKGNKNKKNKRRNKKKATSSTTTAEPAN